MVKPGSRQHLAQLIAAHLARPVQPIPPLPSPMLEGWLFRKQAGDPR
jgi:hypothetical protein